MMRLEEKVAIVAGGASIVGQAIARGLAAEGSHVVVCDMNGEGAESVSADIRQRGVRALAVKANISREDEVRRMVLRVIDEFGRLDILVNNAAAKGLPNKPFHEIDMTEWRGEIDTTFLGAVRCCSAVMPWMIKQHSGRIISVSSEAGKAGTPCRAPYSSCKAALAGFTRAVAQEVATLGITVNCVSPGPINTPRWAEWSPKFPEHAKSFLERIPSHRLAEPEDVASIIVFLASDGARHITGQDYSVDGGLRM